MRWLNATGAIALLLVAGCDEKQEGFIWEVTQTGSIDECNDPTVPFQQTFDYILDLSSPPAVTVALGAEVFATGRISGCNITYESVVWTEDKNGFDIRWQISGDAVYRLGDSTCSNQLSDGQDWVGTETFEIVNSAHPDIAEGCKYILDSTGSYVGPL